MNRQSALVLAIIFFALFSAIAYYGAMITWWSSIILGMFVSLILLNMFYPISELTTDDADFTLCVYAAFIIFGIVLLAIYITQKTLSDVRESFFIQE